MKAFFIWISILSLSLRPWRSSFSQDDSVYFKFAQNLSAGEWKVHTLNVAGVWPQALLGSLFLKFPFSPIPTLNILTWILFAGLILVMIRRYSQPALILAFFAFPMWVQYGISYLPDIYLAVLVYFTFLWFKKSNAQAWLIFPLSVALLTQYQTTAAFILFWSVVLIWQKDKKGWLGLGALGAALFVYALLPKSELQQFGLQIYLGRFDSLSIAMLGEMFLKALQLLVGIGVLLLPTFSLSSRPRTWVVGLATQFILLFIFYKFSDDIISAGVLFTNYLPKVLGAFFVTLGVWGWLGFFQSRAWRAPLALGALAASLAIALFDAFRTVQDLRYVFPMALIWFLVWLDEEDFSFKPVGQSWFWVVPVTALAVFVNLYNLETTQTRWQAAQNLIDSGVSDHDISAGYGWDLLTYEPTCTESALQKYRAAAPADQGNILRSRILLKVPRAFEDEASPQYLIKPHSIFGKTLTLNRNLRQGQSNTPEQIMEYSVLGLKSSVAIINTGASKPAWCFTN